MPPEFWSNAGILIAAAVAALAGYYGQKFIGKAPTSLPGKPDPVIASIGVELGNRQQMDQIVMALNRIGDILDNKKQQSIEEMLKDIKDQMEASRPGRRR